MRWYLQKLKDIFSANAKLFKARFCTVFCIATGFLSLQSNLARAQPCSELGGWVVSIEGTFTVAGNLAQMGSEIGSGDEILVGEDSRGAIRLASSQTVIRINQNSTFAVEPPGTDGSLLKLSKGILYGVSR